MDSTASGFELFYSFISALMVELKQYRACPSKWSFTGWLLSKINYVFQNCAWLKWLKQFLKM